MHIYEHIGMLDKNGAGSCALKPEANDLPLTMGEFLGAANFIVATWR